MAADATMQTENTTQNDPNILWCNFCDYRTTDQKAYLSHSCTEELERKGIAIKATGQNECR